MLLKIYQTTQRAASNLSNILAIAKSQNYNRMTDETEDYAMMLLTADESNSEILFKDLDAVIESAAALKQEIARRRGVAAR
jgi:hypothetical protein